MRCPAASGRRLLGALLLLAAGRGVAAVPAAAEAAWQPPTVALPAKPTHPVMACTPAEAGRLRAAWASGRGPAYEAVAAVIHRAEAALAAPLEFPPRGGQHNQWYQCDACQAALTTVDDTHHKCPLCGKVYSGPPYDDVIFAHRHSRNLDAMYDAAWAWQVSGRCEFAEFAANVLRGYAQRYRNYPYHANTRWNLAWRWLSGGHLFEQTLNEAVVLATRIAPAYDLVHDAGVLSADDHRRVRDGLIVPLLENIDKYKAGVNNWQTWHNAGLLAGGAVIGDEAWVRQAINGDRSPGLRGRLTSWIMNRGDVGVGHSGDGVLFQLEHSVTDDGLWYEGSWGYHVYALHALVTTAETARRLGLDLWGNPRLRRMFLLPAQYTMPDGHLPRFGDDVNTSVRGAGHLFEPAYAAYVDPALLPALPAVPDWNTVLYGRDVAAPDPTATAPRLASGLFPAAGHAILRTAGEAGLVTAFVFGPYGGYHGHLDKLGFVLYGHGRELGVDPGRAASQAYRLPIHHNWYKATVSHNTLMVDGRSQGPATGTLELFGESTTAAAAAARCDTAVDGARLRRLLVQLATCLVVVDEVTAARPHTVDWLYHGRGSAATCPVAVEEANLKGRFQGGEYVAHGRHGSTDGPVHATLAGDPVTTHLLVAAAPGTTVITGDGVGASVTDRVPLVLVERRGRAVYVAAVLEPVLGSAAPQVREITLTATDDRLTVALVGAAGPLATLDYRPGRDLQVRDPAGTVALAVQAGSAPGTPSPDPRASRFAVPAGVR